MNMISKCWVVHCHVWLPEGIDVPIESTCLGPGWFSIQRESPRVAHFLVKLLWLCTAGGEIHRPIWGPIIWVIPYPSKVLGSGDNLSPRPDQNKPHFVSHKGIVASKAQRCSNRHLQSRMIFRSNLFAGCMSNCVCLSPLTSSPKKRNLLTIDWRSPFRNHRYGGTWMFSLSVPGHTFKGARSQRWGGRLKSTAVLLLCQESF